MTELSARNGVALQLEAGHDLVVTNTHGQQVVDTWAHSAADTARFMSAAHTWMRTGRLAVRAGDELVDTSRAPLLTFVEDTGDGHHDLLIPSCDIVRYRQLGVEGYHDNCRDNYVAALAALDVATPPVVPQPLNLFMNVPVDAGGSFEIRSPLAPPGAHVRLRAHEDVIIVLSACPQDIAPTNGEGRTPTGVEYEVVQGS